MKLGPIQIAAKNGYVDIVERLLEAGVNVNNDFWGTPLYYASIKGNIDVIDFLLLRGAYIDFQSFGGTALMGACYYKHGNHTALARYDWRQIQSRRRD